MANHGGKRRWRLRLLMLFAFVVAMFVYSKQFDPAAEDVAGQRALLANRDVASVPWRVDALQLLGDAKALSSPDMQGRAIGTPGGKKAREYLTARYAAIGLAPVGDNFEHPFTYTPGRGIRFWRAKFWQKPVPVEGANVLGMIAGSADPTHYIVVSAHYDHVGVRDGKIYPGADDNASGVAAMLAIATYFKAHPPRHSILFAAFDGEERGLRGAHAFIGKPPVAFDSILVNVNFDMLSRSPVNEIYVAGLHANPQLRELVDAVRDTAEPMLLYGHDMPRPFWDTGDWTNQSDQGVFADRGVPFLYLGVDDHPDYHRPTDTFERLDQKFFTAVANTTVDLIVALDGASAAQLSRKP